MGKPQTKPGRLSDLARHVVLPSGIISTGWPAVRDLCGEFGDVFDEWQDGAGRSALAKRADDKYAATVGGVVFSIPRQVAKTFLVGRIIVALCILFPGLTVLWTAHHNRTLTRTFRSMQGYVRRRKVAAHLAPNGIRTANGEQEIKFRNGSIIMFGAREQGFGRGFEEVDVEVFDEAQILTEKALEDMVAATNQSRHPHGALLFYMGTPPRPTDPGEAFTLKRAKALAGSDDMVYVEFSADEDAKLDDREQWAKANPSFPHRTPLESMLRLRENLPSDDAWRREALGIWDSKDNTLAWSWPRCADPLSRIEGRRFLAAAMTPDRSTVSLAAAGRRSDGLLHVELIYHGPRTGTYGEEGYSFIPAAAGVAGRQGAAVAMVKSHPIGSLAPDLEKQGARIQELTPGDYTRGCGAFFDDVTAQRLRYIAPQPELDAAIGRASRKASGDAWRWAGDDISALVAATQAAQAARMAPVGGSGRVIALD